MAAGSIWGSAQDADGGMPFPAALSGAELADAIPQIVVMLAGDGRAGFFNRRWFAFTGMSAEQSRGWGWTSALYPEDLAAIVERWRTDPFIGDDYKLDYRLRRHDGVYRWMRARGAPLRGPNRQIVRWVGTSVDVDDQKRAEDQRDRLQSLISSNIIGVASVRTSGEITDANDYFLTMLGYERADLEAGRLNWKELTPPEWSHLEPATSEMLEQRLEPPVEREYLRKDGERVPVLVGISRIGQRTDEAVEFVLDLTGRKRAEAAERRLESRLRRLVESDVIGVFTVNNDGEFVETNDAFLEMIGYSRAEFEQQPVRWRDLTPAEYIEADERALDELATDGVFAPFEKEYFRKNGERVPIALGGAAIEGTDETICYILDRSQESASLALLAESEARYRILAEALPQSVLLFDSDDRLLYANQFYRDYVGEQAFEHLDSQWQHTVHPDDRKAVEQLRDQNRFGEAEIRLRKQDGSLRWHLVRTDPIEENSNVRRLVTAIDIDDRKRAEEALRFMSRASDALVRSLDLQSTLENLLEVVVPTLGQWASISFRQPDGRIKTVAIRHFDRAKRASAKTLAAAYPYIEDSSYGTPSVYRTKRITVTSPMTREMMHAVIKPEYWEAYEDFGYATMVFLPIVIAGEVIGTLTSNSTERSYGPADLALLDDLALRIAVAVQNAQTYEREHRVAESLQRAALPPSLPLVAGFELHGYYQPGSSEASIGGDWYDALQLGDGRIVISIGDVSGSGLAAAVIMSSVRQVIRGIAQVYADPALILDAADRALRNEQAERMVTAFVGVIDPARMTMLYASAGHPLPLLRRAGGEIEALQTPGLPLGYRILATSGSRSVALTPGSLLLLYTDGLVESGKNILGGERTLHEALGRVSRGAAGDPVRGLVSAVLGPAGATDDIAILAVSVLE